MNLLRKDVRDMKRLLALALSLLMMLTCTAPALAESQQSADPAVLYPARPVLADDYIRTYTEIMSLYVDPGYSEYGVWHLAPAADGSIVLTDGIAAMDGMHLLQIVPKNGFVESIIITYPYFYDDVQRTSDMFASWSVMTAVPVAMLSGMDFDAALERCSADFWGLASRRSVYDVCPIAGMEAAMNRTTGQNSTVTMTYTFHVQAPPLPVTSGEDITGSLSAEGYMRAFDDYSAALLGGTLVWTKPEEFLGCTLMAIDSLDDSPSLMILDDRIAMLMLHVSYNPEKPQDSFDLMVGMAQLSLTPMLMEQGMTQEEAEAAYKQWEKEACFRAGLSSALCGTPFRTDFYGFDVSIDRDGSSLSISMFSPLADGIGPYAYEGGIAE